MFTNSNVQRNKQSLIFKAIYKQCRLFLSGIVICAGCQYSPIEAPIRLSNLDQKFRLQQGQRRMTETESVKIYRNIVARSLGTQCKLFPSDSRYADLAQSKCGRLQGGMMAFARFLNEEDMPRMGHPFIINNNHIEFVDFPNECWL